MRKRKFQKSHDLKKNKELKFEYNKRSKRMFGDALQTAMQKVSNDPITELGTGDV